MTETLSKMSVGVTGPAAARHRTVSSAGASIPAPRIWTYAELKAQERENVMAALRAADLLGVKPTTL
ncbi:MAG: hypothetical protein H6R26_1706, partial [Proteobacteria bacterium]|nr:hypothetical protein [Pseudomonadota bacterium]